MQRKNKVFFRGVINSDTPMESRFVTPSKGVAFCDGALGSIPKIIFVFSSKRVNKVNKVNKVNFLF